ncbi:MAG: Hpt domain-containing protein, partial [Nitrococcus sp.]|nr:Hpt domain-containing protein [Nitrococcus sp.]
MNEQTDLDYSTLSWVRGELDAALRQAAEALDAYAEDAQDGSGLQLCIARVHQVHGIVQILELDGAAMLTQEMEQLAHTLLAEPAIAGDTAQETLMHALLQLQDYLERVEAGHRDAAILLLPLINELRAARGVATIAESALFAPDLERRCGQARWPRDGIDNVAATAQRVRPLYQRGLLAYLRGRDPGSGLQQMDEALLAMDQASPDERSSTLWWLAGGLTDALGSEEIGEHAAMARRLLSQVEHQLKSAMELGIEAAAAKELARDLLYYLGHASPLTERIATIHTCYDLPALMAEQARVEQSRERLLGPGRDALGCVTRAIHEDLAHIKDTLDLHSRGSARGAEDLATTADSLSRIAETLGVIGLLDARRLVQDQAELVRTLHADGVLDEPRALQVAEALLYVESALARLLGTRRGSEQDSAAGVVTQEALDESEYRQVSACTISEAITELGYIKEAIVQFVESGERERLQGLERNFAAIRGSLTLVAIERLPELVAATDRFLRERVLSADDMPSSQTLDELADAITGIEYCLEALRDGHPGAEHALAVAEDSLRRLGCFAAAPKSVSTETTTPRTAAAGDESRAAIAQEAHPPALPAEADTAIDYSKKRGRIDAEVPVRGEQIDPEILEIFLEEADEVLATLREVFPRWQREADDEEALRTIRRLFHTLKGSGRLAGALLLGELAWSVENLLNRILDHTLEPSLQIFATVAEALSIIPELIGELRDGTPPGSDIRRAILRASILSEPARHAELEDLDCVSAVATVENWAEGERNAVASQGEPGPSELAPFEGEPSTPQPMASHSGDQSESAPETSVEGQCDRQMDPLLYEIFSKETEDHLGSIEAFLAECQNPVNGQSQIAEGFVRSLHTLAGSARMAQVGPIAEVGHELELLSSKRRAERRLLDACDQEVLERGTRAIRAVVEALGQTGAELPDVSDLVGAIEARRATPVNSAASYRDQHEGESSPLSWADALEDWPLESDGAVTDPLPEPSVAPDTAHTRTHTESEPLPEPPAPATAHPPTHAAQLQPAEDPASGQLSVTIEDEDLVQVFLEEADDILRFLEGSVERWEALPDDEAQIAEIHRSLHTLKGGARLAGFEGIGHLCHALESVINDVGTQRVPADDTFFDLLHASLDRLTDLLEQARGGGHVPASDGLIARIEDLRGSGAPVPAPRGDPNRELVEVFLQEAADILGNTEALLYQWRQEPDGFASVAALQRALHTLKGGARMAGFKPIADLSHALEALLNALEVGAVEVGEALFDVLESANDHLLSLREAAANGMPLPAVADLLETISRLQTGGQALAAAVPRQVEPDDRRAAAEPERRGADAGQRQAEQVRVHSQLLDDLVNYAGEVSIYRGRLEQQAVDVGFNLAELRQTVTRLHEQLRTLEIETETQILYRYERDHGIDKEDFDPLELDRFSQIQELSRALSESVSDLTNIQAILGNLNRENETLLLQQSRVNSELQDGLMRTRMVPFANLVPRMRRVVRQACEELGKRAQLKVSGAQDEMDRTMLERLIAPLEHMLRNAVAHGIESPSIRRGFGKAEVGTICVTLEREGADVCIRVSDDGSGLNLDAIRAKAVARGLMKEDA